MSYPPRSNIVYTAQMSALLHADNIDGFVASLEPTDSIDRMLGGWMRANILCAIASCPKVVAFWKDKMEWDEEPGLEMVRFLAEALETSEDGEKIRLLRGDTSDAVAREWHRGMVNNVLFFERLSPAWIGAPGSTLRATMQGLGWSPSSLFSMLRCGRPANAQYWSEWVPFVETMLVHNHEEYERLMRRAGRHVDHAVRKVPAWALAEDVALAQSLCTVIWPNESHYALELPPNFPSVPTSRRQELDLLVQMHAQLDQMGPLMDILATGHLPQETSEVLLPNQGF